MDSEPNDVKHAEQLKEAELPNDTLVHSNDELVEFEMANAKPVQSYQQPIRMVNLILDHMAFVQGLGNLKRWFNKEYVEQNIKGSEKVGLNIFIPSYTLHEFDFIKKGNTMRATNARQAIKFLDQCFELEEKNAMNEDLNEENEPIHYHISLEQGRECGPSFHECLKYKLYSPKIGDFPNYKTKFDNNLIGQKTSSGYDEKDFDLRQGSNPSQTNDIQYENSASYQNAASNADKLAEMPTRLKYLIRATIYKRFYEKNNFRSPLENWKLVTEDPITKTWAKSFGIDCLNVNEAELLLFQNYDVNSFSLYQPQKSFTIDNEQFDISKEILQNTVDTSKYQYVKLDLASKNETNMKLKLAWKTKSKPGNKSKPNNKQPAKPKENINGIISENDVGANGEIIKRERYDAINYAPRGKGKLWHP
ncbi:nonsense-mediated decay protein 4 [Scheffersomyces spartinae]|uniref:Nonsense-mediated decay protein 4 n=1 Tax=Scheffersomyces spartinae TaxID=45513 RepID=A0A9P8AK24_9ASCO|nr:nonsense-mediated decay protein 4 [Scheffersomyces spartinae]KAG7195451.1 nonsense-mediated decay protein 4 [Scheffersomyces spartinae]